MPAVRRLPERFPVGTHYVVEGTPDENGELTITSRYVVLPNGIQVPLPLPVPLPVPRPPRRRRTSRRRRTMRA